VAILGLQGIGLQRRLSRILARLAVNALGAFPTEMQIAGPVIAGKSETTLGGLG